jgi:hypothetical protein
MQTKRAQMKLTVDVTKTTCFTLLCMMKTASPIDSDVAFTTVQARSTLHTATSADTTEFEQSVEDRTIISNIVLALLLSVCIHVVWCNLSEKVDVFVSVELGHLVLGSGFCALQQEGQQA